MKKFLNDIVKTTEIVFTQNDLQVLNNLQGILSSGVESISLKCDSTGKIIMDGDFKSITCTNVKVKKISNKGNICENIADTKAHIQCSHWLFPCPNYKYSIIKKNLEIAIENILNISQVEVESFSTNIVEYE